MSFLLPSVAALGAGLMLLPLGIHLLSRRKRRPVPWGAMEFLLESNRRNRSRSMLEEWLLLLLRLLAVLLAGLVAAGPRLPEALGDWFHSPQTTHLVVLDDSYSMGERAGESSRWQTAQNAIERLMQRAARDEQQVLLLRYSDTVTGRNAEALEDGHAPFVGPSPTRLATGPLGALRHAQVLAKEISARGEACYGCLLSDMRRHDHTSVPDFAPAIEAFEAAAEGLVLGHCASDNERVAANLTLMRLALEPGPQVAGVEAAARLEVKNQGTVPTPEVSVEVRRGDLPLRAVAIGPLQPGEQVTQVFPVRFPSAGPQTLRAAFPDDALPGDNERWLAADFPSSREVLLVDGSFEGREGRAFAAALAPGPLVSTGWMPRSLRARKPESLGDLAETAVLFLLDVASLGRQAEEELVRFVERGGGLLTVVGPTADLAYYNRRLADGELPLLPLRLDLPTQGPWAEPGESILSVRPHRILRVFSGRKNGFLPLVRVAMYHATESNPNSNTKKALLQLPGGEPLLLTHRVGEGRVLTLLTTAAAKIDTPGATAWSNLATLPIFPVLVNELAGWLAEPRLTAHGISLGEVAARPAAAAAWDLLRHEQPNGWQTLRTETEATAVPILEPGAYQSRLRGTGHAPPTCFSANPDPREGQLSSASLAEVRDLVGSSVEVLAADALFLDASEAGQQELVLMAGMALLALLILERLLATRCSHVRAVPRENRP